MLGKPWHQKPWSKHNRVSGRSRRSGSPSTVIPVTGTNNREAALYGTPGGGMLAFVMQSAVEDDVLDQVFATLNDSALRQFTGQRGSLFWVALQGLDAEQLMSIHKQDSDPSRRSSVSVGQFTLSPLIEPAGPWARALTPLPTDQT